MQHVDRTFHAMDGSIAHRDSLVLINTYDYLELKPIADVSPLFREAKEAECSGLYCSEPFYIAVKDILK